MRTVVLLGLVVASGGCVINGGSDAPPVQLNVGAPSAIGFQEVFIASGVRGTVVHDVCVSTDVSTGFVVPVGLVDIGSYGPVEGAPVQSTPFEDLDCPTEGAGWARITWATVTGRGLITLIHSASRGQDATGLDHTEALDASFHEEPDAGWDVEPDAGWDVTDGGWDFEADAGWDYDPDTDWGFRAFASGSQVLLQGTSFEGYDVLAGELEQVGSSAWSVPLHVDYRASGTLDATAAANVSVAMVWQPSLDSSYIVGGSPGVNVDDGVFSTDIHGDAYLLVSSDALCYDYVLFGTTPDGGTGLVTTLGCPK
jgi:hypothetical protein